jgi:hypothetical protein
MAGRRLWLAIGAGGLALAMLAAGHFARQASGAPASKAAGGWLTRNDGEYSIVETPHYIVKTDHTPDVAQLVGQHQEALFLELYRRMAGARPIASLGGRVEIMVFRTKPKYLLVMGKDAEGSQGQFDPKNNRIGVWGPPDEMDLVLEVLRHETTHQFVGQFIGNRCPIWLNEGLGEFFKYSQFSGGQLTTGQVPGRVLRSLQAALDNDSFISVSKMLARTSKEWVDEVKAAGDKADKAEAAAKSAKSEKGGKSDKGGSGGTGTTDTTTGSGGTSGTSAKTKKGDEAEIQYNEAWAMVHFLQGADKGKYQGPFLQYIYFQSKGQGQGAWEKCFGPDTAAFDKLLREYIKNLKPTVTVECRLNLRLLGKWAIEHYQDAAVFKDMTTFHQAAISGKLGGWHVGSYSFADSESIKTLFHCPEDKSSAETCSYEMAPGKSGEPPIIRCRHHGGFVYETSYVKEEKTDNLKVEVVARSVTSVPPPATTPAGRSGPSRTAPTSSKERPVPAAANTQ